MLRTEENHMEDMSKYDAPAGKVFVCGACGKRASNQADGRIDRGWDESCFMNSSLCDESTVVMENGRVIKATACNEL